MGSSLQSYDIPPPHHDGASSERHNFNNVTHSISNVRLSPYAHSTICQVQQEATFVGPMNFPPRGKIPLTTCLAPLQKESFLCLYSQTSLYRSSRTIVNRFQTIMDLVLADSNRWDNYCLFKTVVFANGFCLTSRPRALTSLRDVSRGLADRG